MLLLLLLGIALSLPSVQTRIGQYLTEIINKDYGTDIYVDQVTFTAFGGVKLKKILIKDHHKDTLIFINKLKTNILDFDKLINGKLIFGKISADELFFNLKNYKGEKDSNLDVFIAAFDDGKPSSGNFIMTVNQIYIVKSRFVKIDENREYSKELDFTQLNAELKNFKIKGSDVFTDIVSMQFNDYRGLPVENLSSKLTYTKKNIILDNLEIKTKQSNFKGNVTLHYVRKDFADFNNKVIFDIKMTEAKLATNDIRLFYKELGANNVFNIKAYILGTLNDFKAKNLVLVDSHNTQIVGNVTFRNLFGKKGQEFYMNGDFDNLSSNYTDLTTLLPNILGKTLPSTLAKLGQFSLDGSAEITTKTIDTYFNLTSALGFLKADLVMTNINNIDNASYVGNITMENFNVGSFLGRSELGLATLNLDVNGKGFTEEYLDTKIKGSISKAYFRGYNYSKIIVDGSFKKPIFKGKLNANDPNLFMDFDGLVDISKKENQYKFKALIDYADLKKLNFMPNDSISIFKGNIVSDLVGNSFDNLKGDIQINSASYQNGKDIYYFDDFELTSSFDNNNERTLTINSPDIIEGKVVGKFMFSELPKLVKNSFGSIYTNYEPEKINNGQYLKFNFSVFNKIIEIFYPEISVSTNTRIRGNINSNKDLFKLDFKSPEISAFDIKFQNIDLEIDNKNPLYNTFIQIDSVKNKYYKVSDFSLINVTSKDSLFFRTEFKGGNNSEDFYNLNLYHTIDKFKNSIVGVQKSEVKFKDYLWFLNENSDKQNRVIIDSKLNNFQFDNIALTHENQKINFVGQILGKSKKDLNLSFRDVNIGKIIPEIEGFELDGNLNGIVNFQQENEAYRPTSSLVVDNLVVNNIEFGNLNLDIEGNESLNKFNVNSVIKNNSLESLRLGGNFEIINKQTHLDLDARLDNFNIAAFSNVGGDVISNIRGLVTGNANFQGTLKNPEMNGRMFLNKAGISVPYLNVDYQLADNSIIDITDKQFLFRAIELTDSKYNTKGSLEGNIRHSRLTNWKLDLTIFSNYLIALDTEEKEESIYYGKAFIDGQASITGPVNNLLINVEATSMKGTSIKIPISDLESIGENNYISFLSPEEKNNPNFVKNSFNKQYKGLELNFDLNITPDAEIKVILDKETGHAMSGNGVGNLKLEINTNGKFNMYGDFQIYKGKYNFRYRGLINRDFDVEKYGTIIWEGDPLRARLDLKAKYITSANPGVLLENSSFNKKVPVIVGIGITGNLMNPELDFTIDMPTVSSVLKSEVQTALNDKDTRQTQALYLLASGSFLSPEGGISQNALSQNLFETASGIFGDIFKDDAGIISVRPEVVTADTRPGRETSGTVGFNTTLNISDRITVNGKFGVPIGGVNQSAVVGDVEILYRVNKDGTLNLRVFNRENDINYIGEGIGYTQGLGMSYQVDFNTFNELIRKIFNNEKLKQEKKAAHATPDSEYSPDLIQFLDEKKKKNLKPKPAEDKVPDML